MEPLEKFQNLLIMAAADRRVSDAELRLLADRAAELGISDDQFEDALTLAISGKAELTIPRNRSDLRNFLQEMIRMMGADGRIADAERRLFALASATAGVSEEELNRLIDDVVAPEAP